MKTVEIEISKLNPYKYNAKQHPDKQIKALSKSIQKYGFTQPVVIDSKNCIVIGHGRTKAAEKAGLKTVPCIVLDKLSAKQIKELRIFDNKVAETGWDIEMLQIEIESLKAGETLELENIGFEQIELDKLFAPPKESNVSTEIDIEELASKLVHECPKCKFKWSAK